MRFRVYSSLVSFYLIAIATLPSTAQNHTGVVVGINFTQATLNMMSTAANS